MTTKDNIDLILSAITATAIVFAAVQIKINRKQLYLSTITKCVNDFRNLGKLERETENQKTLITYIDLTNEELFYFQHNYIPKDISREWIEGMLDFMPLTNKKGTILNKDFAIRHLVENRNQILQNFPRIQNAFEVKNEYNFELIYSIDESKRLERVKERKKLIREVFNNVKHFDLFD